MHSRFALQPDARGAEGNGAGMSRHTQSPRARRIGAVLAVATCCCALCVAPTANANPQVLTFTGRSRGMGGTGTSFVGDGAATFHNPAGLDDVERYTLTAAFNPVLASSRAPLAGPGTEQRSELAFGPLFLIGGGVRLSERIVLGLGAYLPTGFGNTFTDVPLLGGADPSVTAFAAELTLPLVFRLLPGLSLGFAPRAAYARVDTSLVTPVPVSTDPAADPVLVSSESSMSGASVLGFQVGARYRVHPLVRVGLRYRSPMSIDISGTTRSDGMELAAESEYHTPHGLRVGVDVSLLERRLLLALDARYLLYSLSHDEARTTFEADGVQMTSVTPLRWNDSLGLMFGAEYLVAPALPVRVGYTFTPSATPKDTASAFLPAPGASHAVSAGVGTRFDRLTFDLGATVSLSSERITREPTAGEYSNAAVSLSLSATYER